VRHVTEEVKLSRALLAGSSGLRREDRVLLEDNLDCLKERLGALGCALGRRCDLMRARARELTDYQVGSMCFEILSCFISLVKPKTLAIYMDTFAGFFSI